MANYEDWEIGAIADKPGPDSMGMHALLVRKAGEHIFHMTGGKGWDGRTVYGEDAVEEAIKEQKVLVLPMVTPVPKHLWEVPQPRWSGLWVGDNFALQAAELETATGPLLGSPEPISTSIGNLWTGATHQVYEYTQQWLTLALRRVIAHNNDQIPGLMIHCDPDSLQSQAAQWYVSDAETKQRDLQWHARLARDNKRTPCETQELEAAYQDLIKRLNTPRPGSNPVQ